MTRNFNKKFLIFPLMFLCGNLHAVQFDSIEIIKSISQNGLQAASITQTNLKSSDNISHDDLYINLMIINSIEKVQSSVRSLLFNKQSGAFQVAMERAQGIPSWDTLSDQDFSKIIEKRLRNSILFILNPEIEKYKNSIQLSRRIARPCLDEVEAGDPCIEFCIERKTLPSWEKNGFYALIMHPSVRALLKDEEWRALFPRREDGFPKIYSIETKAKLEKIEIDPSVFVGIPEDVREFFSKFEEHAKCHGGDRSHESLLAFLQHNPMALSAAIDKKRPVSKTLNLHVPDFEKVLMRFIKENPDILAFATHLVRLPD